MRKLRISVLGVLIVVIARPAPLPAEEAEVCFAEGPYRTEGSLTRVDNKKIEKVVSEVVKAMGHTMTTQSGWSCKESERPSTACLERALCKESLYVDIRQKAAGFSYTIVSLERGQVVGMTGPTEGELLGGIKNDVKKLLSREEGYEYDKAKQMLEKQRTLEDEEDRVEKREALDVTRRYRVLTGLTIGAGVLTAVAAVTAIATAAAAGSKREEIAGQDPLDREPSDIDLGRGLTTAARVTLGTAIAFGMATTVLLPFAIKQKKKKRGLQSATVAWAEDRGMLLLTGGF